MIDQVHSLALDIDTWLNQQEIAVDFAVRSVENGKASCVGQSGSSTPCIMRWSDDPIINQAVMIPFIVKLVYWSPYL